MTNYVEEITGHTDWPTFTLNEKMDLLDTFWREIASPTIPQDIPNPERAKFYKAMLEEFGVQKELDQAIEQQQKGVLKEGVVGGVKTFFKNLAAFGTASIEAFKETAEIPLSIGVSALQGISKLGPEVGNKPNIIDFTLGKIIKPGIKPGGVGVEEGKVLPRVIRLPKLPLAKAFEEELGKGGPGVKGRIWDIAMGSAPYIEGSLPLFAASGALATLVLGPIKGATLGARIVGGIPHSALTGGIVESAETLRLKQDEELHPMEFITTPLTFVPFGVVGSLIGAGYRGIMRPIAESKFFSEMTAKVGVKPTTMTAEELTRVLRGKPSQVKRVMGKLNATLTEKYPNQKDTWDTIFNPDRLTKDGFSETEIATIKGEILDNIAKAQLIQTFRSETESILTNIKATKPREAHQAFGRLDEIRGALRKLGAEMPDDAQLGIEQLRPKETLPKMAPTIAEPYGPDWGTIPKPDWYGGEVMKAMNGQVLLRFPVEGKPGKYTFEIWDSNFSNKVGDAKSYVDGVFQMKRKPLAVRQPSDWEAGPGLAVEPGRFGAPAGAPPLAGQEYPRGAGTTQRPEGWPKPGEPVIQPPEVIRATPPEVVKPTLPETVKPGLPEEPGEPRVVKPPVELPPEIPKMSDWVMPKEGKLTKNQGALQRLANQMGIAGEDFYGFVEAQTGAKTLDTLSNAEVITLTQVLTDLRTQGWDTFNPKVRGEILEYLTPQREVTRPEVEPPVRVEPPGVEPKLVEPPLVVPKETPKTKVMPDTSIVDITTGEVLREPQERNIVELLSEYKGATSNKLPLHEGQNFQDLAKRMQSFFSNTLRYGREENPNMVELFNQLLKRLAGNVYLSHPKESITHLKTLLGGTKEEVWQGKRIFESFMGYGKGSMGYELIGPTEARDLVWFIDSHGGLGRALSETAKGPGTKGVPKALWPEYENVIQRLRKIAAMSEDGAVDLWAGISPWPFMRKVMAKFKGGTPEQRGAAAKLQNKMGLSDEAWDTIAAAVKRTPGEEVNTSEAGAMLALANRLLREQQAQFGPVQEQNVVNNIVEGIINTGQVLGGQDLPLPQELIKAPGLAKYRPSYWLLNRTPQGQELHRNSVLANHSAMAQTIKAKDALVPAVKDVDYREARTVASLMHNSPEVVTKWVTDARMAGKPVVQVSDRLIKIARTIMNPIDELDAEGVRQQAIQQNHRHNISMPGDAEGKVPSRSLQDLMDKLSLREQWGTMSNDALMAVPNKAAPTLGTIIEQWIEKAAWTNARAEHGFLGRVESEGGYRERPRAELLVEALSTDPQVSSDYNKFVVQWLDNLLHPSQVESLLMQHLLNFTYRAKILFNVAMGAVNSTQATLNGSGIVGNRIAIKSFFEAFTPKARQEAIEAGVTGAARTFRTVPTGLRAELGEVRVGKGGPGGHITQAGQAVHALGEAGSKTMSWPEFHMRVQGYRQAKDFLGREGLSYKSVEKLLGAGTPAKSYKWFNRQGRLRPEYVGEVQELYTNRINFGYQPGETPLMFQTDIGRIVWILGTYPIRQLHFFMGMNHIQRLKYLIALQMVGGASALGMGSVSMNEVMKRVERWKPELKEDLWWRIGRYGLVGAATRVNIGARLAMGSVLNFLEGGAALAPIIEGAQYVGRKAQGIPTAGYSTGKAILESLPLGVVVRRIERGVQELREGRVKQDYSFMHGAFPLYPSKRGFFIREISKWEATMRTLGFETVGDVEERELVQWMRQAGNEFKSMRNDAVVQYIKAIDGGDQKRAADIMQQALVSQIEFPPDEEGNPRHKRLFNGGTDFQALVKAERQKKEQPRYAKEEEQALGKKARPSQRMLIRP